MYVGKLAARMGSGFAAGVGKVGRCIGVLSGSVVFFMASRLAASFLLSSSSMYSSAKGDLRVCLRETFWMYSSLDVINFEYSSSLISLWENLWWAQKLPAAVVVETVAQHVVVLARECFEVVGIPAVVESAPLV